MVLLVLGSGCRTPGPEPPNIVLVVSDALRKDHLGVYGYSRPTSPRLDAFAAEAAVFDNAFAQSPFTKSSVATMFTSLYPHQHGVLDHPQVLSDELLTLAELLDSAGYQTAGFVENLALTRGFGFEQGFQEWHLDLTRTSLKAFSGEDAPAVELDRKVHRWLEQPRKSPFFLYLHYMDPHTPYAAPSPYRSFHGGERPPHPRELHRTSKSAESLQALKDCYDEEISYVDDRFGAVMDKLSEAELLENTVVVFTSDHGEGFGEHGYLFHSYGVQGELINMPLLIRYPRRFQPGRYSDAASQLDLLPTLVELAGAEPPLTRGRSLLQPGSSVVLSEQLRKHSAFPRQQSLVKDGWKLVHTFKDDRYELFRVEGDPLDTKPLQAQEVELVGELKSRLREELEASPRGTHQVVSRTLSKQEIERLRSLGYIE